MQFVIKFSLKLLLSLTIVFIIHVFALVAFKLNPLDNYIILSYLINALMAISAVALIIRFKIKYKDQLGFIFMAGSMFKFLVFFLVFYPLFKNDFQITKLEFASFFIPYCISLILETLSLSKLLNELD